ncbi:DNA adenine methylase [Alistipes sp.]|uniref:DNA adenine methylase n=1 Tax=Alistipes sp. TaxID=1872444 RepID=UPI003AEF2234
MAPKEKNKIIVPPLKSQGIKTKLVPWIKSIIPNFTGQWIEPFFGTGVVGFNIKSQRAILADTNPHIIKFYSDLKNGTITPQLIKEYLITEGQMLQIANNNGYEHYNFVKARFNESYHSLDFLFLSRAGFNGMMRFNKSGKWNIPFCKKPNRFSPAYITKITNQASAVKEIITESWDFRIQSFEEIIPLATEDDLIYCDPPYYGRSTDYYNGWSLENEERLFNLLNNTPAKFILSTWHHNDYRENEMIERFWGNFKIVMQDHFYHSGGKIENRKAVVEALVCNFDLHKI